MYKRQALISFLMGWLLWSLLWNGYLGKFWLWPLFAMTPDSLESGRKFLAYSYYTLVAVALLVFFGRIGRWDELARRVWVRVKGGRGPQSGGFVPDEMAAGPQQAPVPPPHLDPVQWPELRAGGAGEAAERLAQELLAGRMTDVDHARIDRAWQAVRARPQRLEAFVENVLAQGAASGGGWWGRGQCGACCLCPASGGEAPCPCAASAP
ncbi:hypothetical protein KBZ21_35370 [Streptomyces sp. A73]|nr:hypothetical protein [Streptomyces sp. A73]